MHEQENPLHQFDYHMDINTAMEETKKLNKKPVVGQNKNLKILCITNPLGGFRLSFFKSK